ncbi:MAG: prevent-host-death family protein [Prevotella sp.]|nr:prevent-host-death family protein [Prevotella sp.]
MMVVSTRDFRTNQTKYLSMAKEGVDVILRSRAGNFKISPISDEDTVVNKSDLEAKLRHALQEVIDAKKGKIQLQSAEDLLNEL